MLAVVAVAHNAPLRLEQHSTDGGHVPATSEGQAHGDLPRAIGRPATDALALIGVTRLDQVAAMTDKELLALHGVVPKAVRVLREELAARGLRSR